MVNQGMYGLFPILAMPFDEQGRIDVSDLQREVGFAIESGAHGVGIAMASEVFKLSETERDLATRTVIAQAQGRISVVINTGAEGTDLAVMYSHRAEELGADAIMVAPPTIVPTDDEQVVEHYRRIATAVQIPLFIQDVSSAPVPPSLAARICRESSNACYLKAETSPTPQRVAEAVEAGLGQLMVFGGAGGNALIEELNNGAVGTMPHCALPDLFRTVWDLHQSGDQSGASQAFDDFGPLRSAISNVIGGSSIHVVKEILHLRGIFKTTYVRNPAITPNSNTYSEVRRLAGTLKT